MGTGAAIPVPLPVPLAQVRANAEALDALPELACADAWTAACRAWWVDDRDPRLRDRSLATLLLSRDELAAWLARRLDPTALVSAHRHATSMRAGIERDLSRRALTTSAFRTGAVWAEHRGGARTVFAAAEDLPVQVEQLCATAAELPAHPFVRAAWLTQAIGAVHPFHDGNGGTSRFLASLELVRASLPPLVLSVAARNRSYIDALMEANRTNTLGRLALVVQDAVQQGVAAALLAGTGEPAAWDARTSERATGWIELADRRWRALLGAPLADVVVRDERTGSQIAPAIARLSRRGYRLPVNPRPRGASWQLPTPEAIQLDLAIAPLRGGTTSWQIAMIAGSIGEDGSLAAIQAGEPVSAMFVAPDTEPDAMVEARFRRWLDVRLEQCVRGLTLWT